MTDPSDYGPFSKTVRPYEKVAVKWLLVGTAVVIVLALIFGVIGSALNWYGAGRAVVSPENVTAQFHDAYSRFEGLKATACNVKQERGLVATSANNPDPTIQVQYQQQETAYEQTYRSVAAQYNAAYDNAFEARLVGPRDLPRPAPSLDSAIASYC